MIDKFVFASIITCILLNCVAKCSANECLSEEWGSTGKLYLHCDKYRKFENCANEIAPNGNATEVYVQCKELNKFPSEIFGAFQRMKKLYVEDPYPLIQQDLLGANQLEILELWSGKLNLTASTFVNAPKLKALNIKLTHVPYIDPQAFHGGGSLRTLILTIESNATLPKGLFDGLRNLRVLSLFRYAYESYSYSYDNTIDFESLRFPVDNNIKLFRLVSATISELKAEMFVNLTQLTMLFLLHDEIERIRPYTFTRMNQLILLDLQSNQIEELTQAMLAGLTNLRTADFSSNRIRRIESGAFSSTPQLRRLDLSYNEIVTLEPHTLLKITHLDLSTKPYQSTVDLSLFCNLPNLSYLFLRSKGISKLRKCTQSGNSHTSIDLESEEVPYNTTQTEEILYEWQGLDSGPPNFFMGMEGTVINVAYIDGIDHESEFSELLDESRNTSTSGSRLALLNLERNNLSDWENNLFDNFVNLKVLDLDHNPIKSLRSGQFNGLGNLLILRLDHCEFTSLDFNVFSPLTNLRKLNLEHNRLRTLTPPEMSMNRLISLDLYDNDVSLETFPMNAFSSKFNWDILHLGLDWQEMY